MTEQEYVKLLNETALVAKAVGRPVMAVDLLEEARKALEQVVITT